MEPEKNEPVQPETPEQEEKDPHKSKVTDEQFWSTLRECGGIYARTARTLQKKYKLKSYTRQTVKERAEMKPELLKDIKQEVLDIAEDSLVGIMIGGKEHNRLEASKFYLKTQGRERGYDEKLDVSSGGKSWADLMKDYHERGILTDE